MSNTRFCKLKREMFRRDDYRNNDTTKYVVSDPNWFGGILAVDPGDNGRVFIEHVHATLLDK